jgi:hypothetical protein
MRSGLVTKMEEWEFSSFREYLGLEKSVICNIQITRELINIPVTVEDFYKQSYDIIREDRIKNII